MIKMETEKITEEILKKLESQNMSTEELIDKVEGVSTSLLKNLERIGFIQRDESSKLFSSCKWILTKEGKSFTKFKEKVSEEAGEINKIVMTLPPKIKEEILKRHPEINLTNKIFKELLIKSTTKIRILSPYIDASIIDYIKEIPEDVEIKFLTTLSKYGKNPILERLKQTRRNLEIKYLSEYVGNVQQFQIHAKIIISDEKEIYIGSANFKETSILYNLESGLISKDKDLIKKYSSIFDDIFSLI